MQIYLHTYLVCFNMYKGGVPIYLTYFLFLYYVHTSAVIVTKQKTTTSVLTFSSWSKETRARLLIWTLKSYW